MQAEGPLQRLGTGAVVTTTHVSRASPTLAGGGGILSVSVSVQHLITSSNISNYESKPDIARQLYEMLKRIGAFFTLSLSVLMLTRNAKLWACIRSCFWIMLKDYDTWQRQRKIYNRYFPCKCEGHHIRCLIGKFSHSSLVNAQCDSLRWQERSCILPRTDEQYPHLNWELKSWQVLGTHVLLQYRDFSEPLPCPYVVPIVFMGLSLTLVVVLSFLILIRMAKCSSKEGRIRCWE